MDYKLAKKLKNAGFPQEPFLVGDDVVYWGNSRYLIERSDNLVKIPSLEELIKECKILFMSFGGVVEPYRFELVGARAWRVRITDAFYPKRDTEAKWEDGDSLEKAFAGLWLELKQRKDEELGPVGLKWCSKHKVYWQDFCDECFQEDKARGKLKGR